MADIEQRTVEVVTGIVAADLGVATITGRSDKNCIPQSAMVNAALPVITYLVVNHAETGGLGDNRLITIQWSAYADGNGAEAAARALIERLEVGITQPSMAAAGLDGCPMPGGRRRYPGPIDPEDSRGLVRFNMDQDFWVTK